jgi:hypothetical protein
MVCTFGVAGGHARTSRRNVDAPLVGHVLGGCLGGATLGTALALATANGVVQVLVAGALGIVTLLALAGACGIGKPIQRWSTRQVPEHWRRYFSGGTTGVLYGLGLGVGLGTRIPSALFPAGLTVVAVWGSPVVAILAGIAFGASRALMHVGLSLVARAGGPGALALIERRFEDSNRAALLGGTVLAAVTIATVAVEVGLGV